MANIIEINITNKEDVYEKYNQKVASRDLINYLIDVTPKIKKGNLKIIVNNTTKENDIAKLIKESLLKEYDECLQEHYHTNIVQFIYLVVGILILVLSTYITEDILKEVILIGGWVFIWALFELEIFNDVKSKYRRIKLKKLINSEIVEIKK